MVYHQLLSVPAEVRTKRTPSWNGLRSLWHESGFLVIPTVSWGTPDTYDFCFLGLPQHSLLAVSSVGVNLHHPRQEQGFVAGFSEMVSRLNPTTVLAYGKLPDDCHDLVTTIVYPTRWETIHAGKEA